MRLTNILMHLLFCFNYPKTFKKYKMEKNEKKKTIMIQAFRDVMYEEEYSINSKF